VEVVWTLDAEICDDFETDDILDAALLDRDKVGSSAAAEDLDTTAGREGKAEALMARLAVLDAAEPKDRIEVAECCDGTVGRVELTFLSVDRRDSAPSDSFSVIALCLLFLESDLCSSTTWTFSVDFAVA